MKNRNKESTRFYSERHENSVCEAIGGYRQPNSGAAKFSVGDVIVKAGKAKILVECKTSMSDKESFSIKKEWVDKNKKELRMAGYDLSAICFNFGPSVTHSKNLYIINESLMAYLVDKLSEENS